MAGNKRGGGFQGGLTNLIREAKRMQAKMEKIKKELEDVSFEADSGNGLVKAVVNGKMELTSLTISEEAYEEEKDVLNDLIIASINKALKDAQSEKEGRMGKVTSGFAIPGLF